MGAFDRLNWQYSGEFDQNFSKKSNAQGFARGVGGWAVLELTGTLKGEPFFFPNCSFLIAVNFRVDYSFTVEVSLFYTRFLFGQQPAHQMVKISMHSAE